MLKYRIIVFTMVFCLLIISFVLLSTNMFSGPFSISQDRLVLHGNVDILLKDKNGNVKEERHFSNMIMNGGFEGIAFRIAPHNGSNTSIAPYNYLAIGSGNDSASPEQTSLTSELARLQDPEAVYLTSGSKHLRLQVTFQPGVGTGTITESGLFDSAAGGNMLARQTFEPLRKGENDSLTITWTILFGTI